MTAEQTGGDTSMGNREILEKAIQKAVARGWKPLGNLMGGETLAVEEIIYNHDFAKALWGKGEPDFWNLRGVKSGRKGHGSAQVLKETEGEKFIPEWQFHLQQTVLADDPIKYLGKNI